MSFQIDERPDAEGKLALVGIQARRFGDDLIPRPIKLTELSFDLAAANNRLERYVLRNKRWLQTRHEPEFRAVLRNGILSYWYHDESIVPTRFRDMILALSRQILASIKEIVDQIISRKLK